MPFFYTPGSGDLRGATMGRPLAVDRRWKWLCATPLIFVLAAGASVACYALLFADGETVAESPSPVDDPSAPLMVAVGDSFISGEGALSYLAGTSDSRNSCHRANTGYPYLVAAAENSRLVNATCSGAKLIDFTLPQHPSSPESVYGGVGQLEALRHPRITPDSPEIDDEIDVVLLSIGGNDAGFREIVETCLDIDCLPREPGWMRRLDSLEPLLEAFYPEVREAAKSARILVVPYPQPLVIGNCVPRLSRGEAEFIVERFLPRLNQLITWEAQIAELEVVDSTYAFAGARLCEPGVNNANAAMNTLDLGRASSTSRAIQGSFHPRELGHRLLADVVLDTLARPRAKDPLHCEPFGCPPGPPPNPPPQLPPGAELTFPADIACQGDRLSAGNVVAIRRQQESATLDAIAGSTVCLSLSGGSWKTVAAAMDGTVRIDTSRLASAEVPAISVIHQLPEHGWTESTLISPSGVEAPRPPWWRRASGLAQGGILILLLIALIPHLVGPIRRFLRRRLPEAM